LSDEELLQFFQQYLPEKRLADNVDQYITELISWGLLIPHEEDGQVSALAVHSLVRDFCQDKQQDDWRKRLLEAAAYYTNKTKLLRQDDKSLPAVMSDMEAFELLMEAEESEKAASLVINASTLLHRWGLVRYEESLYRRIIPKVGKNTQSILLGNLGIFFQDRGDYRKALAEYEKSLKIKEEIGNRAGVASSLGQMGQLFIKCGKYLKAFKNLSTAFSIFAELQSPYAKTAVNDLKELRSIWGGQNFDVAWKEKFGGAVPEVFVEDLENKRDS